MKIKKEIKKIKNSLFFQVFKLIKKNKQMCAFIVLLDIVFLLIFFGVNSSVNSVSYPDSLLFLFSVVLLYILSAILIYSLFKYIIIKIINSFVERTHLDFKGFGRFALLNAVIMLLIVVIYEVISVLLRYLIRAEYFGIAAYIILILYFMFFYLFVNTSHFIFLKEMKVGRTLKKSFNFIFKRRSYIGVLFGSFLFFVVFYLLYLVIALIARIFVFTTQESYLSYGPVFEIFLSVLMFLFVYFLVFFNRIYFRLIVGKR